ncbi:MAG: nucleotide pyrophosphohydrolase [Candidatus Gracilibacteria bacterium]
MSQDPRFQKVIDRINNFREAREWKQFHSPKNLAMSLAMEASEVMEFFQWCSTEEAREVVKKKNDALSEELADVGIYLLQLCEESGVDLLSAIERKMDINESKYPVEKAKGNATKYNEL